jgi:hypothetical protein
VRSRLTLSLALLLPCACKPPPQPQILWPESVLNPKPYEPPPPRPTSPDPVERPYMCHPGIAAELRFEQDKAEPLDRERALAQLRERIAGWDSLADYDRPYLFLPLGYHDDDESPGIVVARAEAMRALAIEAGVDPEQIVCEADIMDPPHPPDDRKRAVLIADSPVSCLL